MKKRIMNHPLTADDLKENHMYEARKRKGCKDNPEFCNDRWIYKIEKEKQLVMYAHPDLRPQQFLEIVTFDQFLRWAGKDLGETHMGAFRRNEEYIEAEKNKDRIRQERADKIAGLERQIREIRFLPDP